MRGADSIHNLDARGAGIHRAGSAFQVVRYSGRKLEAKWSIPSLGVRYLRWMPCHRHHWSARKIKGVGCNWRAGLQGNDPVLRSKRVRGLERWLQYFEPTDDIIIDHFVATMRWRCASLHIQMVCTSIGYMLFIFINRLNFTPFYFTILELKNIDDHEIGYVILEYLLV